MMSFKNIVTGFAVASFASIASAGALGSDGIDTAPVCIPKDNLVKLIKANDNDLPTGLLGSNKAWKMELYADPSDGSWSLVGEKLNDKTGKACRLNSDVMGFPADIQSEKWYQQYFAQVPANKEKMNQIIQSIAAGKPPQKLALK